MCTPLEDNLVDQQEKGEENNLSVEEQGGACENPSLHEEVQDSTCKALMYMQVKLQECFVQQLWFILYFIYGTKQEIERQRIKIKQFAGSSNPHSTPVPFIGGVSSDDDNYLFQVPFCGQGHAKINVKVNPSKCYCRFDQDDENMASFADIIRKSTRCINGGALAHEMRLHKPYLPACIKFSLLGKKPLQLQTPTNFEVTIRATDEDGREIFSNHTAKQQYAACFYNTDAGMEQSLTRPENSLMPVFKKILVDNQDEVLQRIQNWGSVISSLVFNGALDKSFLDDISLTDKPLSEERKSEILRNLYQVENIMPMLIEALQVSGGNEELVTFLHQCTESMENQSSSLE